MVLVCSPVVSFVCSVAVVSHTMSRPRPTRLRSEPVTYEDDFLNVNKVDALIQEGPDLPEPVSLPQLFSLVVRGMQRILC